MPGEVIKRVVKKEPAVVSAHTVAGEASAMLHVMAEDTRDLELTLERIRKVDGGTAPSPRWCSRRCSSGEATLPRRPAAVDPRLLRLRAARAQAARGDVPDAWYWIPVFYFSNLAAVYRDGDEVPRPADTRMLDYELELAAVIGEDGGIEGFTIMNDWSARDLQGEGDGGGLGPAKGKDFATSLGPELVSPGRAARRPRPAGGRARERRGPQRLADGRHELVGTLSTPRRATPRPPGRRRSAPEPWAAAAPSTATAAGRGRAMRWSSR